MKKGFTLPEIVITLIFVALVSTVFVIQKLGYDDFLSDTNTKTFTNSIYYALVEDYYPTHGHYPASISADVLPTVDQSLWGTATIYYEPANCTNDKCAEFILRAPLIKESDFIRSNPTN